MSALPVNIPRSGGKAPRMCPVCGRPLQPTALEPATKLWCSVCCITTDLAGELFVPPEAAPIDPVIVSETPAVPDPMPAKKSTAKPIAPKKTEPVSEVPPPKKPGTVTVRLTGEAFTGTFNLDLPAAFQLGDTQIFLS